MANDDSMLGAYGEQLKQHEHRLNKIDVILDKVRNRPPVWMTFTLATLLGVVGWLLRAIL